MRVCVKNNILHTRFWTIQRPGGKKTRISYTRRVCTVKLFNEYALIYLHMSSRLPYDWAGEDLTGTTVHCQSRIILYVVRVYYSMYVRAYLLYVLKRMVHSLVFVGIRQKTRRRYRLRKWVLGFLLYYLDFFLTPKTDLEMR